MPVYMPHMQQLRAEQHRTSRLQHAAWGRLLSYSSPSPAVLLYIFLKLDSAPLQSYCCIFIHNPLASSTVVALPAAWPSELHTRAPLVHHSVLVHLSCTTRTRAPLVHHSVLVHLSCTTLDHRRGRPTIFR